MALGKWITNMADPCPYSTCSHCTTCDKLTYPAWWNDKEIGPPRALSNGATPAGMSGVYEYVPGPVGVFGAGYSVPPPIAPMPPLFAPTYGYTSSPPVSNISASTQKLREMLAGISTAPTEKFDPKVLLEPLGCKACGSQEKNKHKLMCPCDPARSKSDGS